MSDKYQSLPIYHFADDLAVRHTKRQLKCVLFGNFGAMNQGDDAILHGEILELQKITHISIVVVARFPERIPKIPHVKAIRQYDFNKVRAEIRKSDFIIIGGGGLINKIERSFIGFFYQLFMLSHYFLLPSFYKKKVYILGIGIYANANKVILSLLMPFLRSASIITVRDFHTYNFLKKKNLHSNLYKDNSYLLPLITKEEVLTQDFFKKFYKKDTYNIALSLVKPESNKAEKHMLKEILAFIGQHKEIATFWFYATDFNPNYENDLHIGNKLKKLLYHHYKETVTFHIVPISYPPAVTFSSFKLMNLVIATRFHAAVFAYRQQIPFVGIAYDLKCSDFVHSVGKRPLSLSTFTAKELNKYVL